AFRAFSCSRSSTVLSLFFSTLWPATEVYTLSLHDALPIYCWLLHHTGDCGLCGCLPRSQQSSAQNGSARNRRYCRTDESAPPLRSEEHTSELQSRSDLVCRLLLEKKKIALTAH